MLVRPHDRDSHGRARSDRSDDAAGGPVADHRFDVVTVFSSMMGKPTACDLYLDEETVAAQFAARWLEQADRLRGLLESRTAKTQETLDEMREALEQRMAAMDH